MIFALIVLFGLALTVGILFLMSGGAKGQKTPTAPSTIPGEAGGGKPCPLCGTVLARGERVHSVQYASSLAEKEMEIWGCPWCHTTRRAIRRCPVCHDPVPEGEPVMARVFTRPGRISHVHVLGCRRCRSRRIKA